VLEFIAGVLVGGVIGFLAFVICSFAENEEQSNTSGETDAESK
jgi:NhaP-type Na+/H+ or K+/H+ antiporter